MAHHRSSGGESIRSRGVSRGVVFALLSILLIAAIVVTWQDLGDQIDRQAEEAAAQCVEGRAEVPIVADPDIAPGLSAIAGDFAETNPVVRDRCVTVAVRPGDAKITLDGLTGTWDAASMGAYPAAWVPQSSVWSADLAAAKPDAIEGDTRSLVSTPVVLAVSPALNDAIGADLDWSQVPTLQRRDNSLADVGLPGWGSLRMAMPLGAQSDASALAAQAVATRVTRTSGPLTAADAESPRVSSSVPAMLEGAPLSPDGTPKGAATLIADAPDPAKAGIHVVPITEQQLFQMTRADTRPRLAELIPGGPTPIADYPIVRLSGTDVADFAADAVAEFIEFASQPEQLQLLTELGFRGDAPMPKPTPTVTFPRTPNPMPTPENGAIVAINRLVYGPASVPASSSAPAVPSGTAGG
ncbi:substrate-binding domain-containing protein [Gordonia terrae]|uniref:substrate-binding domain-containing protein n=1 Tax=Gordonia terrae TaxID=2055 RepID=UPI003F6D9F5F